MKGDIKGLYDEDGIDGPFEKRMAKPIKATKYWYRIYVGECPVCGKDKSYRERVYGPRPAKDEDRYYHLNQSDTYDWCDSYP